MRELVTEGAFEGEMITALARMEDVDHEALRKKYMTAKENGDSQPEKSSAEIQAEYDVADMKAFLDFFEMDDIDPERYGDTYDLNKAVGESLFTANEEIIVKAKEKEDEYKKTLKEELKIEIVDSEQMDFKSEDTTLAASYERRKKESKATQSEAIHDSTRIDSGYKERRTTSSGNTRSWDTSDVTFQQTRTVSSKRPENEEEARKMQLQAGFDFAVQMAQKTKNKGNDPLDNNRYMRRRKGIKGLWDRGKAWFKSKDAGVVKKVGLLLSMQVAMAVISGKFEFDGPLHLLSYLGLTMGVFYVHRQLEKDDIPVGNVNLAF
jgi:hypothetical protein